MSVGASAGIGVLCSSVGDSKGSAGGCGFLLHFVPLDFPVGDLFVDMSFGDFSGYGGSAFFRPGFEIGSPWFRVGGVASPVDLSVRFHANAVFLDGYTGGSGGVSVGASWALMRLVTIDAAIVGGGTVLGPTNGNDTPAGGFFEFHVGGRI